jgi:hypothetical protein
LNNPYQNFQSEVSTKRSPTSVRFSSYIKIKLIILFKALSAVIIIQTWFRRRQAIFEIRRKAAWTIYQNIEYAGEQDQLQVIIS